MELKLTTAQWRQESDVLLRRVERNALIAGTAMTLTALLVRPRPQIAFAVAAGCLLVGFSYWSLKQSVTVLVDLAAGRENPPGQVREKGTRALRKLALRYALLALLAYVMIARLRLHPWGLLAGASSVVAGVSIEALRLVLFRKS